MEGSNVVSVGSANIVRAEDRQEQTKFTLINIRLESSKEGERVDRNTGGGRGDEERNRLRKSEIESGLRVEEIEGSIVRRTRGVGRGKDSSHSGRKSSKSRESRGSSGRTKDQKLELGRSEEAQAAGLVIRQDIDASGGCKSSFVGGAKSGKIGN